MQRKSLKFFEKTLVKWSSIHGRKNLPWRNSRSNPYQVWVSEIMLQQTQVSRVIEFYKRFLQRFPTIQILAQASWEDFLPYYQGLGYYSRGKNMLKTAKIIVETYKGKFPKEKSLLEKLPGIGKYTSAAILSFAHKKPHLAFDTNHQKVLGRFLLGNKKALLDLESIETEIKEDFSLLNAAIMDFANIVCLKKPLCEQCPLQSQCKYFEQQGKSEILLEKSSTKENFPNAKAQVMLILHENHKKYFSSQKRIFHPFFLPQGVKERKEIQEYFLENFHLSLSVRPVKQKFFFQNKPYFLVYAQVLQGKNAFLSFSQKEAKALILEYIS